jgi:hypothetical protein
MLSTVIRRGWIELPLSAFGRHCTWDSTLTLRTDAILAVFEILKSAVDDALLLKSRVTAVAHMGMLKPL